MTGKRIAKEPMTEKQDVFLGAVERLNILAIRMEGLEQQILGAQPTTACEPTPEPNGLSELLHTHANRLNDYATTIEQALDSICKTLTPFGL